MTLKELWVCGYCPLEYPNFKEHLCGDGNCIETLEDCGCESDCGGCKPNWNEEVIFNVTSQWENDIYVIFLI